MVLRGLAAEWMCGFRGNIPRFPHLLMCSWKVAWFSGQLKSSTVWLGEGTGQHQEAAAQLCRS